MINYQKDGFSHEEVVKKLFGNREVRYEYEIVDRTDHTIGFLSKGSGAISYDSSREIMRTANFDFLKTEILDINMVDERIKPYFCLKMPSGWLRYPLGIFVIEKAEAYNDGSRTVNVNGYDFGILLQSDRIDERLYIPAGALYTNQIEKHVRKLLKNVEVQGANATVKIDSEYEIGTSRITIVNDLLKAINYSPVHFDQNGTAICAKYVFPEAKKTELKYITDKDSIINDGIERGSDIFDIPNKFIRYTENSEGNYLKSVFENNNPDSILSIAQRGRTIADIESVGDIASQEELNLYTKRIAIEKSQAIETVTFKSVNVPLHDYRNCLFLECREMEISGKYIEYAWEMELEVGGSMLHKCKKVVSL